MKYFLVLLPLFCFAFVAASPSTSSSAVAVVPEQSLFGGIKLCNPIPIIAATVKLGIQYGAQIATCASFVITAITEAEMCHFEMVRAVVDQFCLRGSNCKEIVNILADEMDNLLVQYPECPDAIETAFNDLLGKRVSVSDQLQKLRDIQSIACDVDCGDDSVCMTCKGADLASLVAPRVIDFCGRFPFCSATGFKAGSDPGTCTKLPELECPGQQSLDLVTENILAVKQNCRLEYLNLDCSSHCKDSLKTLMSTVNAVYADHSVEIGGLFHFAKCLFDAAAAPDLLMESSGALSFLTELLMPGSPSRNSAVSSCKIERSEISDLESSASVSLHEVMAKDLSFAAGGGAVTPGSIDLKTVLKKDDDTSAAFTLQVGPEGAMAKALLAMVWAVCVMLF